jgi:hypothetical protein
MVIINFSLQAVENNDSCRSDGDENEGQQSEQEPDSLAAHLVAWLGDAEGSKEGGRKSLKESHALMVRVALRGVVIWRVTPQSVILVKNPGRRRNIQ